MCDYNKYTTQKNCVLVCALELLHTQTQYFQTPPPQKKKKYIKMQQFCLVKMLLAHFHLDTCSVLSLYIFVFAFFFDYDLLVWNFL